MKKTIFIWTKRFVVAASLVAVTMGGSAYAGKKKDKTENNGQTTAAEMVQDYRKKKISGGVSKLPTVKVAEVNKQPLTVAEATKTPNVVVRDHRTGSAGSGGVTVNNSPIVRDHRKSKGTSSPFGIPLNGIPLGGVGNGGGKSPEPIVRDHREGASGSGGVTVTDSPIIRDHRRDKGGTNPLSGIPIPLSGIPNPLGGLPNPFGGSGESKSTGPIVRDHREGTSQSWQPSTGNNPPVINPTSGPIIRDHRDGSTSTPTTGKPGFVWVGDHWERAKAPKADPTSPGGPVKDPVVDPKPPKDPTPPTCPPKGPDCPKPDHCDKPKWGGGFDWTSVIQVPTRTYIPVQQQVVTVAAEAPVHEAAPVVQAVPVMQPAATVDLAIAQIRTLDAGTAERGAKYRIWLRNLGNTDIMSGFEVAVLATDGTGPTTSSPSETARISTLAAGEMATVDIRLPAAANQLGAMYLVVDALQEITESNELNNASGHARSEIAMAN